jgi:hypothetical protein
VSPKGPMGLAPIRLAGTWKRSAPDLLGREGHGPWRCSSSARRGARGTAIVVKLFKSQHLKRCQPSLDPTYVRFRTQTLEYLGQDHISDRDARVVVDQRTNRSTAGVVVPRKSRSRHGCRPRSRRSTRLPEITDPLNPSLQIEHRASGAPADELLQRELDGRALRRGTTERLPPHAQTGLAVEVSGGFPPLVTLAEVGPRDVGTRTSVSEGRHTRQVHTTCGKRGWWRPE